MYTFETCQLDPARFELHRAGVAVHVEPQVFEVLVYLRRPPRPRRAQDRAARRHLGRPVRQRLDADQPAQGRAEGDRRRRTGSAADRHGARRGLPVRGVGDRRPPGPGHAVRPGRRRTTRDPADPLLHLTGRRPHRLRLDRVRTAPGQGGELADPPRPGVGQPDLGTLDRRAVGAPPTDPLRRARLRHVRLGRPATSVSTPGWRTSSWSSTRWGSTGSPCSGCRRAARSPSRTRSAIPSGSAGSCSSARYARGRLARAATPDEREEAALDMQVGRVGWRRDDPAYRQVFAAQFLPDADRERWDAFNALQRATTSTDNVVRFLDTFANVDVSALAAEVTCPDPDRARARRPAGADLPGPRARGADPRQPDPPRRQRQPHRDGRRAGVAGPGLRARRRSSRAPEAQAGVPRPTSPALTSYSRSPSASSRASSDGSRSRLRW